MRVPRPGTPEASIWSSRSSRPHKSVHADCRRIAGQYYSAMIIPDIKFGRHGNAMLFRDDEIYMSAMNCTSVLTMDNESETALPNLRPRATSTGMKILIVDDNPDTLRLLEFLMSADGYSVRTAGGAE